MDPFTIEIKELNMFYGKKHALQNINLTIERGMFGLLGRNGAGKTTLMKTLATLLHSKHGEITISGVSIQNRKEISRMIGYLPQDFSMYPHMSVYAAMNYLGVMSGLDRQTRSKRIPELLERVNLKQHDRTKVKALSGGMRRRLGIAQAILHDPKVLIVDEPTAGLDPEERIRFRNLLSELAEDRIVILSTHIVGDIEATCEEIAIMDSGKLLYRGTVRQLTEKAEGKVYLVEVSKNELSNLKRNYMVTGMLTMGDRASVRMIADQPPSSDALLCTPNIEDAYMFCMLEHGVPMQLLGGER